MVKLIEKNYGPEIFHQTYIYVYIFAIVLWITAHYMDFGAIVTKE
jgi:hypothetical protein